MIDILYIEVSRYQNVSILDFVGAKDDGDGGDNWSCKMCKAPVKLSLLTNQHPAFYSPDALPVAQPTTSEHWRESTVIKDKMLDDNGSKMTGKISNNGCEPQLWSCSLC